MGRKRPSRRGRYRRRRTRRTGQKILLRFLVLAAAFVVVWMVAGNGAEALFARLARARVVERGTLETVVRAEVMIVRREEVYRSPIQGRVELLVGEGSWVRGGEPVCRVEQSTAREQLLQERAEVTEELRRFQAEEGPELEQLRRRLADTDSRIRACLDELQQALAAPEPQDLQSIQAQLQELFAERGDLWTRYVRLKERGSTLEAKLAELERSLGELTVTIVSRTAGVVSYTLDGLEEAIDPARMDQLEAEALYRLAAKPHTVQAGERVKAGQPVFRVVEPTSAYLCIPLPTAHALRLLDRGQAGVRFVDFPGQVQGKVVALGPRSGDGEGYAVVTVLTEQYLEDFTYYRKVKAEVVVESVSGVLVPRTALVDREGQPGVYVLRRATVRYAPVTVQGQDRYWVAVEGIQEGTLVITTPWLVKEGMKIP